MDGDHRISLFLVFFIALLAVVVCLQKWLHDQPRLSSFLPEAAMVLLCGMVFGFLIHLLIVQRFLTPEEGNDDGNEDEIDLRTLLSFSPQIFFIALLPPILFNSGLRIGPLFFRHLLPICLFAILGTTISAVSTAFILKGVVDLGLCGDFQPSLMELLTFGALISSTDPISTLAVFQAKKVDPQLFYLVFGESALNDALAIVLFDSFSRFLVMEDEAGGYARGLAEFFYDLFLNSIGSCILGVVSGLCTAFLFKQIDMRHNRLLELCLYLLLVYIPFLVAEVLDLSGIVTILFTGVAANRYVVPNLSAITKVNADMLFRLLAHLAETSIFLELGLSVFGLLGHWNWSFIGYALVATLFARALNVYPIALLFNRCLLHETPSIDELDFTDHITQFRRAWSPEAKNTEAHSQEAFQFVDAGIINKARSFSEKSCISEATATPLHRKDLKIRRNTLHMFWYSGLRGAVSYACARMFPNQSPYKLNFVMTTMALVLITVFLLGGTTELALNALGINVGVDEETYMRESLHEPVVSNFVKSIDDNFIRPWVIRDFHIMNGIHDTHRQHELPPLRRPRTPVDPTIEITESGYLDKSNEEDFGLEKLVTQDTLFDYGAQM